MNLATAKYRLTGEAPLKMHNGQLADPFNFYAKEMKKISSKRGKTEADYMVMAHLEFLGGLYLDKKNEVIIPGNVVEAMLKKGATAQKLGKVFSSAVFCEKDSLLEYKGPREPEKLWEDVSFRDSSGVRIGPSRIMRMRPIFDKWAVEVEVMFIPEMVNEDQLDQTIDRAGLIVGLCDHRPRYGRFTVKKLKG